MKYLNPVILLVLAVTLFSCKQKEAPDLEEMARLSSRPEAVLVRTERLVASTFYHELISNGKVTSLLKAIVPFRVSGMIRELNIVNGQKVNEGDLLAVIEDFEYRSRMETAEMNLEKAKINFQDELYSRYLVADTGAMPSERTRVIRIRSGLGDAETALDLARYNLDNTRLYAPISGTVANMEAIQWNPSSSYTNLCTIINDEMMEVTFPVIESEYSFLEKGMPVNIIPFINDSTIITGTVTQINPQVDETGMIKIRAGFRNNGKLIDGMNVRVVIRKPVPGRLVVPKEALVIRQGKDVIFVRQDSLAIWKYVKVEYENSTSVSVSEGLEPGDLVIVAGNINLAHETIVREE